MADNMGWKLRHHPLDQYLRYLDGWGPIAWGVRNMGMYICRRAKFTSRAGFTNRGQMLFWLRKKGKELLAVFEKEGKYFFLGGKYTLFCISNLTPWPAPKFAYFFHNFDA